MSRSKAEAKLTPAQRRWLLHLRRCAHEGQTVRAYAKRHRLSEWALYTATRELRAKGVLAPAKRSPKAPRRPRRASSPPQRFVEVKATVPEASASGARWRARLPNGVVLEGTTELAAVVETLARL